MIKLKDRIRKTFAVSLATLMLAGTALTVMPQVADSGITANAASVSEKENNDTIATANSISIGNTVNGNISKNDKKDFYKVTLGSSGKMTISLNAYMKRIDLYIYDADGHIVDSDKNLYWNSTTQKITAVDDCYLTKGTYYICLSKDLWNTGNYDFKTIFTSSQESFTETGNGTNNTLNKASTISVGKQYKGQIAKNDDKDFYKITLNSSGKMKFSLNAYIKRINLYIYDVDGHMVDSDKNIYRNNTTQKITYARDFYLTKGTYYICLSKDLQNTGSYDFKTALTSSQESFTETGNGNNNTLSDADKISLAKQYKGQIALTDDKDFYKFTFNSSGKLKISLNSDMKEIALYIYDVNGNVVFQNKYIHSNKVTKKIEKSYDIALKNGTYYLCLAKAWKNYGNYSFKVYSNISATGIKLSKTELSLQKGKTSTITATVTPSNATNKNVTWTTSNSGVATVSNGKITAKSTGTATITAKTDNGKKATCKVTVKSSNVNASSVKLSKTSVTIGKGKSTTIKATVSPSNTTNKKITWTTSNKKVATVSNGKITAKGLGSATITAKTANGKKATCKVTVRKLPTGVKLNKTSATIKKGKTLTLKATVTPSENVIKTLKWSTSNSKVATVANGKITAKAKGTATITVKTVNGKTAKCKVKVN